MLLSLLPQKPPTVHRVCVVIKFVSHFYQVHWCGWIEGWVVKVENFKADTYFGDYKFDINRDPKLKLAIKIDRSWEGALRSKFKSAVCVNVNCNL